MSSISDFLSGRFLIGERSYQNWKVITVVVLAALFMVYQAHSTEAMVMKKASLNKELKVLKAEFIESSEELMKMRLESSVRKEVEVLGLSPSEEPPFKIKVD